MTSIPQWLHATRYTINQSSKVQKCLGVPFGQQIKPTNMYNFCLDKISKQISGWENWLLSFTRTTILMKHILQSITTYHIMYSTMLASVLQQINCIFKDFLWGFDKGTRIRKMPLVAWNKLTQPRDRGGLGFIDDKTHAQALLRKWVLKALIDPSLEWAKLFITLSIDFTQDQCRAINMDQYTSLEKIMLGMVHTCRSMTYTTGLWKAWVSLRCHQLLSLVGDALLAHWQIEEIINSLPPFSCLSTVTCKSLTHVMGKLEVTRVAHLWDPTRDSQKNFDKNLDCIRGVPVELKEITSHLLEAIQETKFITEEKPTDPNIWSQSNNLHANKGFSLTNQQTYLPLLEDEWTNLNNRWQRQELE